MEEYFEKIKSSLNEDFQNKGDTIFTSLVENVKPNVLPESIFVRYFLPCFTGRSNPPNWVLEWISIAGTPTSEVMIISDQTNQPLFIVPSLLSTNALNYDGNVSFKNILDRFDQISNNLPTQGQAFLADALGGKGEEFLSNSQAQPRNLQLWQHIYERYNIQLNTPSTQSTDVSSGEQSLDDFISY